MLILVGIGLFILELHVTSYGLLTIGGVIAIVLGGFALWTGVNPEQDAINVSISPWLLALVVALSLAYVFGIVRALMAMRNRHRSCRVRCWRLVGAGGVAQTLIAPRGVAYAGGEAWSARSAGPEIAPGSAVRVVGVDGLELIVEPGDTEHGEHGRGRDARMTGTAEELIHHHGSPLTIAGEAMRSGPSAVAVVGDTNGRPGALVPGRRDAAPGGAGLSGPSAERSRRHATWTRRCGSS